MAFFKPNQQLNYIWIGLIFIGMLTAVSRFIFGGDTEIMSTLLTAIFDSAETSFTICLGLAGIMSFWMGIMQVGTDSNLIQKFSRLVSPFFRVIFPSLKEGSPAFGTMTMNFTANMLGLDNAATPLGLEAMQDLEAENPDKKTASDAMIMFLVLNTAGVTIIPTSVIALRQSVAIDQLKEARAAGDEVLVKSLEHFNGADIFIPTLIVTFLSFIVALFTTAAVQKINLFKAPVLVLIGFFMAIIAGLYYWTKLMPMDEISKSVAALGSAIILLIILSFILAGFLAKIDVYSSFVEGAKGGFKLVIQILPYLVAMLFAVSIFRTAGCLDYLLNGIKYVVANLGMDTRFVDALPVGLMKPLSGSGARGVLVDIMDAHGVNSFAGLLGSIMQGGTETTLYVLTVYFGSVGITNYRYAIWLGLFADLAAMIIAIFVAYYFYGNLA